jgi:hypothetical protein
MQTPNQAPLKVGDWLQSLEDVKPTYFEVTEASIDNIVRTESGDGWLIFLPRHHGRCYQLGGVWQKCSPQKVVEVTTENERQAAEMTAQILQKIQQGVVLKKQIQAIYKLLFSE